MPYLDAFFFSLTFETFSFSSSSLLKSFIFINLMFDYKYANAIINYVVFKNMNKYDFFFPRFSYDTSNLCLYLLFAAVFYHYQ